MRSNIYKLITKDGLARRGEVKTAHGKFQTPTFMPVGTYAAVKSLSPETLEVLDERYSVYLQCSKGVSLLYFL